MGVNQEVITPIHFCEKRVKTKAKGYQNTILKQTVKSLNVNLFKQDKWTFQQDPNSAHKVMITYRWLRENVPDIIDNKDWSSNNPNLNPLDYKL